MYVCHTFLTFSGASYVVVVVTMSYNERGASKTC